jgi:hypothetical protein
MAHKNKVCKLLIKGGFNVTQIVTDLFGATGQIIVNWLLEGNSPRNILRSIERSHGYRLKKSPQEMLDALEGTMSEVLRFEVKMELNLVRGLGETIKELEATIRQHLIDKGHRETLERLETIPGVSAIGAMVLLVELGCDVKDFRSAKALGSWAGMCPGSNESAGKRRSGKTPHGSSHIKRLLREMAAVRTKCYFRDKFNNLRPRRGYKVSIMAIEHRMRTIVYHVLVKDVPYEDHSADYEELVTRKNAARWLRNLKKYNLLKGTPA